VTAQSVVEQFYNELWNDWQINLIDVILAPQIQFRGSRGAVLEGREAFRRYLLETRASFPDWNNRIDELLQSGIHVAVRLTWTGTHTGAPFSGYEAEGVRVEYVGAAFFTVSQDEIENAWVVGDTRTFWNALCEGERDA
jgi:predicted ester cyclase